MSLDQLREFLGWMTVLNFGFLTYWALMFCCCRNLIYRMHTKWFRLSEERFDELHYQGMAIYKIGIFLLCLMPYLALRIIG